MLLPIKVVLMNLEGSFRYHESIFALQTPCLFWSSIRNLFAEMKAISIPEKNAENKSVIKIMIRGPESILI